jgi:hypothetical protein
VPPKGLESTIATFHPASLQRDATAEAADPVPIAITSNVLVILSLKDFTFVKRELASHSDSILAAA